MADKRKLQRIPMANPYTTGDAQDWTYEYTWEDFNAAITMWPTAPLMSLEGKLKSKIIEYFRQNPDIAPKKAFRNAINYSKNIV